jgi:hypothetical protein
VGTVGTIPGHKVSRYSGVVLLWDEGKEYIQLVMP